MKLLDLNEFNKIEENIGEDALNAVNTLMVIRKIKTKGGQLSKLYKDRAKEQIVKTQSKGSENTRQKERATSRIETIDGKIDVINTTISDLQSGVKFMKTFVDKKVSVAKANARLDGLHILDKFYKTTDLKDQIVKLKTNLMKNKKELDVEKKAMTEKQKKATQTAKEDKGALDEPTVKTKTEPKAKTKTEPKAKTKTEPKVKTLDKIKTAEKEISKLTNKYKEQAKEKDNIKPSDIKSDKDTAEYNTILASDLQQITSKLASQRKLLVDLKIILKKEQDNKKK